MGRPLLLAALLPLCCGAQYAGTYPSSAPGPFSFPALGPGSPQPVLMDPGRVKMSQSVSMMATSGGGGSYSQTLY